MRDLDFKYDPCADVLTVEGKRYSGQLFRDLASILPIGALFRLEKRENEVIYVHRLGSYPELELWPPEP